MRGALVVVILLAGCLDGDAPVQAADPPPPPLPPPRDVHPDGLVGLGAVADRTGQVPDSDWARECVRQWTSGHYTFNDEPVVGAPCRFLPTAEGTLFWHVVAYDGERRYGVPAAPIPRPDGFYDWAVFDQPDHLRLGGTLALYLNGSDTPEVSWGQIPADARDGLSAVRLADGSVHVLLYAWSYDDLAAGRQLGRGTLYHAWWLPGDEPRWETYTSGSVFNHHTLRPGPSGAWAIGAPPGEVPDPLVTNTAYLTRGGALEAMPPVAGQLFDIVEAGGALHACVGLGSAYLHAWMELGETPGPWLYEPIAPGLLAQLAFTCDIAAITDGLVVVVDSPAIIGGGPNPAGGSWAYTKTDVLWEGVPVGAAFHSGDDLVAVAGAPLHVLQTGNGTTGSDPQCGVEARTPVDGQWRKIFCNHHGDWSYGLDGAVPTIVASAMVNPPYSTWLEEHDWPRAMTSVALVLPPTAQP